MTACSAKPSRRRLIALSAGLIAANAGAWIWAWLAFGDVPALFGTALLAWVFGLRHAVDGDHIAAIDNVVRRMAQDGKQPLSVGLWFSLGHSTVVILACLVVAATASSEAVQSLREAGGFVGTAVSAGFLLLLAGINLLILRSTWQAFRAARRNENLPDAANVLSGSGPMTRMLRPALGAISRSWHMYPLGFLFGLGFDTSTEVGLLALAATQAARGLSTWQVLVFPMLFTAGMALVDTADSILMTGVYGWASIHPVKKLWYNLTVTVASVLVAVLIGIVEAVGLVAERFDMTGGVWSWIAALNQQQTALGLAVIGIFSLCWGISAGLMWWKRLGAALPAVD